MKWLIEILDLSIEEFIKKIRRMSSEDKLEEICYCVGICKDDFFDMKYNLPLLREKIIEARKKDEIKFIVY